MDKMEVGKVSGARTGTPGVKCSVKVELCGSVFHNEGFKRWFNLGCPGMAGIFALFSIKEYKSFPTL